MSATGRSLELYFIDGQPDGMLTAEVFNWTGHVLMTPRTRIKQALDRIEASYTGVYILLGMNENTPLCYIGESEDVGARLRSHDVKKDWWTQAVIITSSANNLHKAHVKYLESRMVEQAKLAGRATLENGNTPPRSSLSEAAIANMEAFFETVQMVLPAIRVDLFMNRVRPSPEPSAVAQTEILPRFVFHSPKHDLTAHAVLDDGEFIVLAGSKARLRWEGMIGHSYENLNEELRRAGILRDEGDFCVFTENYAFSSTSAAGAVVIGRVTNGPRNWKLEADGRSYRNWEADQLNRAIV